MGFLFLGLVTVAWALLVPIVIGRLLSFLTEVMIGPCRDENELRSRRVAIFATACFCAFMLWFPMVFAPIVMMMTP